MVFPFWRGLRRQKPGAAPKAPYQPQLHPLEDRLLPSPCLGNGAAFEKQCVGFPGPADIFRPVNNTPAKAAMVLEVNVAENAPKTVIDLAPLFASVNGLAADQGLRLFIIANTNPELVTVTISDSDLSLTFAAGQHGSATVTVRGRDVIGAYADVSFLVTVQAADANEPGMVLPLSEFVANKVGGTSPARAA